MKFIFHLVFSIIFIGSLASCDNTPKQNITKYDPDSAALSPATDSMYVMKKAVDSVALDTDSTDINDSSPDETD